MKAKGETLKNYVKKKVLITLSQCHCDVLNIMCTHVAYVRNSFTLTHSPHIYVCLCEKKKL